MTMGGWAVGISDVYLAPPDQFCSWRKTESVFCFDNNIFNYETFYSGRADRDKNIQWFLSSL